MNSGQMWIKETWEWCLDPNRRKMRNGGEDPIPSKPPGSSADQIHGLTLEWRRGQILKQPQTSKTPEFKFWLSHLLSDHRQVTAPLRSCFPIMWECGTWLADL